MNAYRIYDPIEEKFVSSGRSLYASNGRTIWMSKSGAKLALKNMPPEIRDRLILKEYTLAEVQENIISVTIYGASDDLIEVEGDLHRRYAVVDSDGCGCGTCQEIRRQQGRNPLDTVERASCAICDSTFSLDYICEICLEDKCL